MIAGTNCRQQHLKILSADRVGKMTFSWKRLCVSLLSEICKTVQIQRRGGGVSNIKQYNIPTWTNIRNSVTLHVRQRNHKRSLEVRSCNHCFRAGQICITYSVCVLVALDIHHAMRMRHTVVCGRPIRLYYIFSTLSTKHHDFRGKKYSTQYVFWLSLQILPETFLILRRTERRCVHKCTYVFMWSARYSRQTLMKLQFLQRLSKNPRASSLMIIRPVGAELFHADGRTGRHDEAKSLFAT